MPSAREVAYMMSREGSISDSVHPMAAHLATWCVLSSSQGSPEAPARGGPRPARCPWQPPFAALSPLVSRHPACYPSIAHYGMHAASEIRIALVVGSLQLMNGDGQLSRHGMVVEFALEQQSGDDGQNVSSWPR
jgi:hypothetical protein